MANYARVTLATFRSLMKERLGSGGALNAAGTQYFWKEDEIDLALNEAIAVWQMMTGDFVEIYNQQIPQGSAVIPIDTTATPPMQFVRIRRSTGTATTATTGSALYPLSVFEMDQGYYGRQGASSGTPEYWAPLGIDRIVIYPKASTTQNVGIQYYSGDPRLDIDGSTYLNMGDEEVLRILEYAQWVLSFKEGLQEALVNTSPLKDMFLTAARLRNSKLEGTSLYKKYMGSSRDEREPERDAEPKKGLRG